jgi:hypothetical protein
MMADELLAEVDLVPAIESAIASARELERALLANDIPVLLARPPQKACCGGACACSSRLQLLVRPDDAPRVGEFLRREWLDAVEREGTGATLLQPGAEPAADGALACPACGFQGELVDGACGDCGLQLE